MIKIVYVVSTLQKAGPINQLYNLVKYINRDKYDVQIITLGKEKPDNRIEDFKSLGVSVLSLNIKKITGMFDGLQKLQSVVEKKGFQVVHSQGIRPDMLVGAMTSRAAKICTIRNYPQLDYKMTYGGLVGRAMCILHNQAMKKFDICAGVSEGVSRNLYSMYGLKNVYTVRNGVDGNMYYPLPVEEKFGLRQKLHLPVNKKIWISVGHLSIRKDPLFLIRAWKKHNVSNGHIIFLGNGHLHEQCLSESDHEDNIFILGRADNVNEYLQAGDYFISASRAEGLPNTVLEALACGLPVCLSDIAPHREIIDLNPESGFLFELGSENSLINSVRSLEATGSAGSEAALSLFKQHFDARIMARGYENLYDDLLS